MLGPLNIFTRTVFVCRVHSLRGASPEIRDTMYFLGLCYCNYQIFLLFPSPPSLPRSPRWTGVLLAALRDSVCVSDCGKISRLSVRVPRSLCWLFPWGPPGSEGLSPTIALRPFSSQQPLVAAAVAAEFPCPAFSVLDRSSKPFDSAVYLFRWGRSYRLFSTAIKKPGEKHSTPVMGAEIQSWICSTVGRMVQTVTALL